MIVNIRGYSGSGKSTCVKNIIKLYNNSEVLLSRKRRALVTRLYNTPELNECIVLGPYDDKNQTNGCDTIAYNEQVKLLIEFYDDKGYDVLFEGMMLSTNHTLITELAKTRDITVLYLDVDIETIKKQRKQRALSYNRDGNFKHEISVMNNDNINNSLLKIRETINDNCKTVTQQNVLETYIQSVTGNNRTTQPITSQETFDLGVLFDNTTSNKNKNKKLPNDLFYGL